MELQGISRDIERRETAEHERPAGPMVPGGRSGFTAVELMLAITVVLIGLVSMAGVFVSVSQGREAAEKHNAVLARAQDVMEEIKGVPPSAVPAYDGSLYGVTYIKGMLTGGAALEVSVDTTNPRLLVVTVRGAWAVRDVQYTLELRTDIFNSQG